jgi:hypothetical protein
MTADGAVGPGSGWSSDPRRPEAEDLYARYSYGVDSCDREALTGCFSDDVRFGAAGEEPTQGRGATVDRLLGRSVPGTLHTAVNILVAWGEDGSAAGRADFTMIREGAIVATGRYADRLVRTPAGDLVFAERVIHYGWRRAA